jgi:transcriptional antiterminator RfaH
LSIGADNSRKMVCSSGLSRSGIKKAPGKVVIGRGGYIRLAVDRSCRFGSFRAMPFWSVVRSLPMKERFAASQFELRGFETFLTLVATKRASQPLFASYFFVRIVEQWRAISTCFGVLCLVRVGDCPSKMPDSEIENLKSMIVGGFIRLPEAPPPPARRKIAVGSRVRVTAGPFGGLSGLYQGQGSRDRERILLSMLGGQRPVLIAAGLVVPLSEEASR